ncbi:membrane hypothetical protein [Gammaproteobacteria bacterium]
MNNEPIYQELSTSPEIELYISDKEIDQRNKLLRMLLEYVRNNKEKIDYSAKVYLDYTLIDLVLKSVEVKNPVGKDVKIQIIKSILKDSNFIYWEKDVEEFLKISRNRIDIDSAIQKEILARLERDSNGKIIKIVKKEVVRLANIGAPFCYVAFGKLGLWLYSGAAAADAYLTNAGWLPIHVLSDLMAGQCISGALLSITTRNALLRAVEAIFPDNMRQTAINTIYSFYGGNPLANQQGQLAQAQNQNQPQQGQQQVNVFGQGQHDRVSLGPMQPYNQQNPQLHAVVQRVQQLTSIFTRYVLESRNRAHISEAQGVLIKDDVQTQLKELVELTATYFVQQRQNEAQLIRQQFQAFQAQYQGEINNLQAQHQEQANEIANFGGQMEQMVRHFIDFTSVLLGLIIGIVFMAYEAYGTYSGEMKEEL